MKLYWIAQLAGWSLYGIGTFMLVTSRASGLLAIYNVLAISVSGFAISHGLRYLYRRPFWQGKLANLLPKYALVLMIATILWETIIITSLMLIYPTFSWSGFSWFSALFYFVNYFLTLLIWTLFYQGYQGYKDRQQSELDKVKLQLALKEAQLQGLRFQMNPHFLFNALNSIRTLALDSPNQTREMITRLSALLRYNLKLDEQSTVTLQTELDIVRHYLAIEQVRFESRLALDWQIAEDIKNATVLPLSIQTLVENAVKYGIDNNPQGGTITIRAFAAEQNLIIEIVNPGKLPVVVEESIGCQNTRQRLQLQFGPSATLTLKQTGEMVTATVSLPLIRNQS